MFTNYNNMNIQPVTQRFRLSDETRSEIFSKTPSFGFNGLGEVVFRRTYSRDNEDWNDVVVRVIEGTMSIRKEHFYRNSLFWDDNSWQSFARDMALSLFDMEWLPPGRGLWMMGTDFTYNKGAMALNNCFRADTKFWTEDGLRSFNDFEDGEQVLVRGRREWMHATVKSFGEQEIWKLTIQKKNTQREIYTTSGHRWLAKTNKGSDYFKIKTTEELEENWKLETFTKRANFHNMEMCSIGIQHGLVFGDGTIHPKTNNCKIQLYADKLELCRFFSSRRNNTITGLPNTWKDLPPLSMNKEYLFGFLAGWFATNGSISNSSEMVISNKDQEVLEWLRSAFFNLDIWTSPIGLLNEINPIDGSYKPLYMVQIYRDNLPETFFLRDLHRGRYKPCKENPEWMVVDVQRTGITETVWCVIEPNFQEFTLEDGVLTKNCAATDTTEDFVLSAEWTMDALMNGVGVGFTTYWRGEATRPDKNDTETFVIPDSREGWVQSLIILMCSYIDSPRYGKCKFPVFDYSVIREAGKPINGFGGLSSGPGPLQKLHSRVESYLDSFCLGYLEEETQYENQERRRKEYNHTRLIADVFNAIGACVVAGNVRRSAQICMGDVEDQTFINLKNYAENPERGEIGWMSNNSVVLKPDCDYEDFAAIPEMAKRIIDNGEPGMINLVNVQKYGRYGKEMKDDATLVNPCFSGDTMIAVADGRGAVSIKELAEEEKDVPIYSMNPETGDISIKWGRHPRITGYNQKLLRIHFSYPHRDQFMDVTPNHKFFTTDGRQVEAKDLHRGDSLPVFKKNKFNDDYIRVYNKGKYRLEHRMIKEFYDKNGLYQTFQEGAYKDCCLTHNVVVHHKDENKNNNHTNNLEISTASDYNRIHNKEYVGEGNPMFGRTHSEETKRIIGNKAKTRCQNPEYRQMLSDAQTPELREKYSKNMREQWTKEYYDNIEQTTDLICVRLSDTELKVAKTCENQLCQANFLVPWSQREYCFCSRSCANTKAESIELRKEGQKITFESKAKQNFHKQVMIYKDLQENMEVVQKRDWINACKNKEVTFRFNRKSSNTYIASGWKEFKQMADDYNHRVAYVEEIDGDHTVYNITVDDNHTLVVVTKMNDEKTNLTGVSTFQCGEIALENFELCNLSETFPPRCANKGRFFQALRFATFYSSTVSLLPTHRPETNSIVAKNRRIGVSISGIAQWVSGEVPANWGQMNYTKLTKFLRDGYGIVRSENARLANEAGIPASVRVTTIKPSGSISLLAGVTPGMHYPVSRYAIRRMRIGNNSPLVPSLIAAGIPYEPDSYSDNTLVFEFVIDHGNVRPCEEVSPWEQFGLVAMLQRCYSDNCVSATIYFDKEKDAADVEKLLAMHIPVLKSVSMLPHSGHGYAQAPYEPITEEKYNELYGSYGSPEFDQVRNNVPEGSMFCSGDTCEIPLKH